MIEFDEETSKWMTECLKLRMEVEMLKRMLAFKESQIENYLAKVRQEEQINE